MNNTSKKKYLNSIYVKKTYSSVEGGIMLGVGIKKEDLLRELQAIPADERGWINLSMGSQKNNPDKFSTWLDERPRTGMVAAGVPTSSYTPGSSPAVDDDLPF